MFPNPPAHPEMLLKSGGHSFDFAQDKPQTPGRGRCPPTLPAMTTYALIPVKELEKAKARLALLLRERARHELALAMFRDVLEATMSCDALDSVAVVSRDDTVLTIAAEAGAEGMDEMGGLNEALTSAAMKLRAPGAARLLVLASDLPLADAGSIVAALEADADVALVPSRDGGTNALVCAPGAIEFQFGPESARRHLDAAKAAGLRLRRLDLPRLAFDIDTPDDLKRLRATDEAIGQHTREALERIGLFAPPTRKR